MLVKEVKKHMIRKGNKVGKIYLPEEWIGKNVIVYLHSEKRGSVIEDALKKIGEING